MEIIIIILWLLIFTKLLLFWLWLWQLKEYRLDRFLAHFETQGFEKAISSFWRLKFPKFTKKIIVIFFTCLAAETFLFYLITSYLGGLDVVKGVEWVAVFFWVIILTTFFIPLILLFFQALSLIWRKIIINKAALKRAQFTNLLVIGITGSYGKTSTKEFLTAILSSKFKVLSTPSHQNTDVAIAQLILKKLTQDVEIFIVEMAAYKRGEITSPCQIVKPKIGILTAINEQHLATYGSLENIVKTKYELIESLPENGLAIFNGDDDYCYELYKMTQKKKRIYSFQSSIANVSADLHITSLAVNRDFLSFKIVDKEGKSAVFKVNLLGAHNVSNILAAACCAKELRMSLEEIAKASPKIESWQSGIQLKKGIGGLNIIDATYSANPDGVISHLEYLKIWPGKKVIVMPCLIELGKASKEIHREIGRKIGEVCDLSIIITQDRFQEIGEGATEKGMKGQNILFTDNPKEILGRIQKFTSSGDVILLESRVPKQLISLLVISD
jgi:UDP-N-acetylmuramoyl-tripeptide--D-alanyl-D-alanine ligase